MTDKMKTWLHEHGLTATQVAERAGLICKRDVWRMLSGRKPLDDELKATLIRVYGMTEQELKEAIP